MYKEDSYNEKKKKKKKKNHGEAELTPAWNIFFFLLSEDAEKREYLYTVGGNAFWWRHSGSSMRFPKKVQIKLPYNQEILLLDIYLK